MPEAVTEEHTNNGAQNNLVYRIVKSAEIQSVEANDLHSHRSRNQSRTATCMPESIMRYNAMYRNGNAAPSLHPDSAASKCLIWAGTCLSAHLPPTTAAARIGSVGVRHAATAKLHRKFRPGMSA